MLLVVFFGMGTAMENVTAQTPINLSTITNGTYAGFTVAANSITFDSGASGEYVFTGSTTTRNIVVPAGITVNITLNNVTISDGVGNPIQISQNSTVNLTILNTNTLSTTTASRAGIFVPAGAAISIKGGCPACQNPTPGTPCQNADPCEPCSGATPGSIRGCTSADTCKLVVIASNTGAHRGAGIGGNGSTAASESNSGAITFHSGVIYATGGSVANNNTGAGAGIGGGGGGGNAVGNIIFYGGKIIARGGDAGSYQNSGAGSGIGGGGNNGTGGSVTGTIFVNEGHVIARGGGSTANHAGAAAGIGGGGGGGNNSGGGSGDGWIVVNGGFIQAYGGTSNAAGSAAGIGGGGGGINGGPGTGGDIGVNWDEACVDAKGGGIPPVPGIGDPVATDGKISITGNPPEVIVVFSNNITGSLQVIANATATYESIDFQWYYQVNNPNFPTNLNTLNPANRVQPTSKEGPLAQNNYRGTCNILDTPIPNFVAGNDYYFRCHIVTRNAAGTILDQALSRLVHVVVLDQTQNTYFINYEDEYIGGFTSGQSYSIAYNLIGGINPTTPFNNLQGNTIPIQEEWFGNTITITQTGVSPPSPQYLFIPSRPDNPTITTINIVVCGTETTPGSITGINDKMEYRYFNSQTGYSNWEQTGTIIVINDVEDEIEGDLYEVRVTAVPTISGVPGLSDPIEGSFASLPFEIRIKKETMETIATGPIYRIPNLANL